VKSAGANRLCHWIQKAVSFSEQTYLTFVIRKTMTSSTPSLGLQDMSIRRCSYTALEKQDRHAHAYTNITFILTGSLTETVGAKSETAGPLSIVVKPEGTEHIDEFGPGGALALSIRLDHSFTSTLQDWGKDLMEWRWQHCGPATRWFLLLFQILQQKNLESQTEIENSLYETLAALSHTRRSTTGDFPRWLDLIKQEIDDDVENCGRVRDLAERAGVHPVYLARKFRSCLGVSVSDYVKQRRVEACTQLLSVRCLSLASIACQAGFSDQSHMGRVFKSKTGITPDTYRRLIVSNVL
jgi:AraC family transcriptional regulator